MSKEYVSAISVIVPFCTAIWQERAAAVYHTNMKTCIISGSTRTGSQSTKFANYFKKRIENKQQHAEVIDLSVADLPVFKDIPESEWPQNAHDIKTQLQTADGFVFVTPEWNGMVSVGLLNLFHYLEHELAHKPVLFVGISATRGGSYPVLQLRTLGYKNRRFIPVPEQLIITDCKNVFNDEDFSENAPDIYIKKRAEYALSVLLEYQSALGHVRSSGIIDFETYPNGM